MFLLRICLSLPKFALTFAWFCCFPYESKYSVDQRARSTYYCFDCIMAHTHPVFLPSLTFCRKNPNHRRELSGKRVLAIGNYLFGQHEKSKKGNCAYRYDRSGKDVDTSLTNCVMELKREFVQLVFREFVYHPSTRLLQRAYKHWRGKLRETPAQFFTCEIFSNYINEVRTGFTGLQSADMAPTRPNWVNSRAPAPSGDATRSEDPEQLAKIEFANIYR